MMTWGCMIIILQLTEDELSLNINPTKVWNISHLGSLISDNVWSVTLCLYKYIYNL